MSSSAEEDPYKASIFPFLIIAAGDSFESENNYEIKIEAIFLILLDREEHFVSGRFHHEPNLN